MVVQAEMLGVTSFLIPFTPKSISKSYGLYHKNTSQICPHFYICTFHTLIKPRSSLTWCLTGAPNYFLTNFPLLDYRAARVKLSLRY